MRVLHLTRDFPPHTTGGVSAAVGGLVSAQRAAGIDCRVLSFDGWRPQRRTHSALAPRPDTGAGDQVLRVRDHSQADAAVAELSSWPAQVVHVHDGILWRFADTLQRAAGPIPSCFTAHVLHGELQRLRGLGAPTLSLLGEAAAVSAADAVVAPSAAAAAILARDHPDAAPGIHRIGLGATAAEATPAEHRELSLLYSGRFADIKGTAELIDAVVQLLAGFPRLRITIAGGNPESPRSERRWRRRFAAAIPEDQQPRVQLTGWLDDAQLSACYSRALAVLCPSWFESFGLAALEAMAHGVAVVGTTGGALAELIEHGRTGLLAPPREATAFAELAARLVADPELARVMGRKARHAAHQRFRWSEVASSHLELYQRLASTLRRR